MIVGWVTSIHRLRSADTEEILEVDVHAFVGDPTALAPPDMLGGHDITRFHGARHAARRAGFSGFYGTVPLGLRVPGPLDAGTVTVPVDGLTWVSVHPDVRRRGVLRAMMAHHLQDARARGASVAALHASEPGIYGRFGYGVASHDVWFTLDRGADLRAPVAVEAVAAATDVTTEFHTDSDGFAARLAALTAADPTLGTVTLPESVIRSRVRDHPENRRGREPHRALLATRDGRDVGAAVYRRSLSWESGAPDGKVEVSHLVALDSGALLALGRRLVDMDLMTSTRFTSRGLDDPLLGWAGSLRTRRVRLLDGLWLRPVDVGRMLTGRGYAAAFDVTLDLTDVACPVNAGTWRLVSDDSGVATCERTDRPADLACDVAVLGELYLGLRGAATLAAHGRITELTPGSVAALTRGFATGTTPVGGAMF